MTEIVFVRQMLCLICLPVISNKTATKSSVYSNKMFMLKKKKPQVDTTKQMKAVAWDLSKIVLVFVGIRAASIFLNQEN
ncbi:hypothetical protein DD238_006936 [Peronospora effusa]|uniref:RxLR effector candidate protein n=1 Tax=Peronospora effusa TaxID=542832 RepID=A0A3M6VF50_9STRA|nr:hypothetical protein DD238_006936 [Peronospora effusa]